MFYPYGLHELRHDFPLINRDTSWLHRDLLKIMKYVYGVQNWAHEFCCRINTALFNQIEYLFKLQSPASPVHIVHESLRRLDASLAPFGRMQSE